VLAAICLRDPDYFEPIIGRRGRRLTVIRAIALKCVHNVASLAASDGLAGSITVDLDSQNPVSFSHVLHNKRLCQLLLNTTKSCMATTEKQIINIYSNTCNLTAVIASIKAFFSLQLKKAHISKLFVKPFVPSTRCLFRAVQRLIKPPDETFTPSLGNISGCPKYNRRRL